MSIDDFEEKVYSYAPKVVADEWRGLYPERCTWTYIEYLHSPIISEDGVVSLTRTQMDTWWSLKEVFNGEVVFSMDRSRLDGVRKERINCFGALGVSQIDTDKNDVIITEGVSDYLTAKLMFPSDNVLGFTNLGGSTLARSIVVSLFKEAIIVSDNDSAHEGGNIGYRTSRNLQSELRSYGLKADVYLPETKDLSGLLISRINNMI